MLHLSSSSKSYYVYIIANIIAVVNYKLVASTFIFSSVCVVWWGSFRECTEKGSRTGVMQKHFSANWDLNNDYLYFLLHMQCAP